MPALETSLSTAPRRSAWLKKLLREPLVHFLAAAMVLFIAYRALHPETEKPVDSSRIVLTADDLSQLSITWLAQGRPRPTPEQMQYLVSAKVREEILYREALALGLDKDDTIIKRRLAQKMEFLADDLSDIPEPSSEELKTWFEANGQRFAMPPRISFSHVYFSLDRHGERTTEAATAVLSKIAASPSGPEEAVALGDPFMFQDTYGDRSFGQVATLFGPEFAQALFSLKPGSWRGPIKSGYGLHLIWIDSMTPGRIPAFEEVEPSVRSEWVEDRRSQVKRKMYDTMRARYQVVLPDLNAGTAPGESSLPQGSAVAVGN